MYYGWTLLIKDMGWVKGQVPPRRPFHDFRLTRITIFHSSRWQQHYPVFHNSKKTLAGTCQFSATPSLNMWSKVFVPSSTYYQTIPWKWFRYQIPEWTKWAICSWLFSDYVDATFTLYQQGVLITYSARASTHRSYRRWKTHCINKQNFQQTS